MTGHDEHFLSRLDRITRSETDLALSLYRDHGLVSHILQVARPPESADRIAISLAHPKDGPFVIVTRKGKFVTCLGKGMAAKDTWVLTRDRLDTIIAQMDAFRERKKKAEETLGGDDATLTVIRAVVAREDTLARVEMAAYVALAPLVGPVLGHSYAKHCDSLANARAPGAQILTVDKLRIDLDVQLVETTYALMFAHANLAVALAASDKHVLDEIGEVFGKVGISPTKQLVGGAMLGIALRGVWFAARFADPVVPLYRTLRDEATDRVALMDAALSLWGIGLRHARFASLLDEAPAWRDPKIKDELLLAAGEETLRRIRSMPDDAPFKSITRVEDVPVDLAKTTLLSSFDDVFEAEGARRLIGAVPLAARADVLDFFYPEAFARAWGTQKTPERSLAIARRQRVLHEPKKPVVAAPKPGRNDPCFCGSGKKYKKCHGA